MLDQSQIDDFQKNGAVLLKGVFADFVDTARDAIEENMQNPSWRERTYRPDDGGQAFFQDYVVWDQFDGYRALVRDGNSVVTPWHQDQPYYLCEGRQSVSFWVPLDFIPRERTIEYIAGSHRWGKDFKPQRFDGTDLFEGDTSETVPDVDNLRNELDILGWEMEPGDAVAFNFRTLHGAPANASPNRRRVISMRWVGDDAVFAERLGATSPAFPDLEYKPGTPFEAPEFPVLYSE